MGLGQTERPGKKAGPHLFPVLLAVTGKRTAGDKGAVGSVEANASAEELRGTDRSRGFVASMCSLGRKPCKDRRNGRPEERVQEQNSCCPECW